MDFRRKACQVQTIPKALKDFQAELLNRSKLLSFRARSGVFGGLAWDWGGGLGFLGLRYLGISLGLRGLTSRGLGCGGESQLTRFRVQTKGQKLQSELVFAVVNTYIIIAYT